MAKAPSVVTAAARHSVLENHTVKYEADVLARHGRRGTVRANEVQDLHNELAELAVLDELAEVKQAGLLGIGDARHELHHAVPMTFLNS